MLRRLIGLSALIVLFTLAMNWLDSSTRVPLNNPALTVTTTHIPLPDNFTLIPAFTPAYPCQLQQASVYDEQLCRSERLDEKAAAETDSVVFILRDYHVGTGCWSSINTDVRELRLCQKPGGQITTLANHLTSELFPAPDGHWFAFTTQDFFKQSPQDGGTFRPHVYRVNHDGTQVQRLDSNGWPPGIVGTAITRWSTDSAWLELTLWDGTETNGWLPYRLKADGSSLLERLK